MATSPKTTALVAAFAVALVAGVEVATPHTAKYDSRVRITGYIDNQSFLGRVGSERKACKRKRLVTVWKRNPGAMDGPPRRRADDRHRSTSSKTSHVLTSRQPRVVECGAVTVRTMPGGGSPAPDRVRAAEVVGTLCLATDLGMGFPFEHGLQATLIASRLARRMGVDRETETRPTTSRCSRTRAAPPTPT